MIGSLGDAIPGTPLNPFNIPGLPGAIVIPGITPPPAQPQQPAPMLPTPASADAGLLSVVVSTYNQMTPAGQEQAFRVLSAQGGGASAFMRARFIAAGVAGLAGVVLAMVYAQRKKR